MTTGIQVDKCLAYIKADLEAQAYQLPVQGGSPPSITLSRLAGCGVAEVAEELATLLQASDDGADYPWSVFNRSLVKQVLEDHKLPKEVAKFMPEDRVSAIQDAVEELLGLHPPSKTLHQQTSETIRRLAGLGRVILIGRGGNVITEDMAHVFHVRLVAPLKWRIEQIMERDGSDARTAGALARKMDLGRKRYLRDHLREDIDDPLQYDLVINTARMTRQTVAKTIAEAVIHWARTLD